MPKRISPDNSRSILKFSEEDGVRCFGKDAEIAPRIKDRYQQTVARIKCAGVDANGEQVNRGMARACRPYAKDHDLYVLEHGAKVGKRGLWADSSPTPPWRWRKNSNVRQV